MMKKRILMQSVIGWFLAGAAMSAYAFDPATPAQTALETLKNTDCQVDAKTCHYFAAVETAAYFDVCPDMLTKKIKGTSYTPEQRAQMKDWLTNWSALDSEELKRVVLAPNNVLRQYLADDAQKYLLSIPAEEVSIECSRLGFTKQGAEAEDMTDVLQMSKNFNEWQASREKAKQDKAEDAKFKNILDQVQKKLD